MLTFPAPAPLNGDLLEQAFATAGLVTTAYLSGIDVVLPGLNESDRAAALAVLDAHPAKARTASTQAGTERSNAATIRDRAEQALTANRTDISACDTILGLPASLNNSQRDAAIKELARQSKRQAQELNGLIRLLLNRYDGTD